MRNDMADKIQMAYKTSKNIYDDVLTQGFISREILVHDTYEFGKR